MGSTAEALDGSLRSRAWQMVSRQGPLSVLDKLPQYPGARRPLAPPEQERLLYGTAPGDDPAHWVQPNNRALCPTCGEVLSGDTTFDQHLAPGRHADGYKGPWCLPPEERGLALHAGGYWTDPAASARRQEWKARSGSDIDHESPEEGADAPEAFGRRPTLRRKTQPTREDRLRSALSASMDAED